MQKYVRNHHLEEIQGQEQSDELMTFLLSKDQCTV